MFQMNHTFQHPVEREERQREREREKRMKENLKFLEQWLIHIQRIRFTAETLTANEIRFKLKAFNVPSIQKNIWGVIRVRLESVRSSCIVVYFYSFWFVYVTISLVGVTNILNVPYIERTRLANVLVTWKTSAHWHPGKSIMEPLYRK